MNIHSICRKEYDNVTDVGRLIIRIKDCNCLIVSVVCMCSWCEYHCERLTMPIMLSVMLCVCQILPKDNWK